MTQNMCKTHMEETSQLFRKTQPIRMLMGQLNNVELTKLIHHLIHCKAKSMLVKILKVFILILILLFQQLFVSFWLRFCVFAIHIYIFRSPIFYRQEERCWEKFQPNPIRLPLPLSLLRALIQRQYCFRQPVSNELLWPKSYYLLLDRLLTGQDFAYR